MSKNDTFKKKYVKNITELSKYTKMSKNDTIFKKWQNFKNVKNWQIF